MEKSITIKGLEVRYDIEEITQKVWALDYDKTEFDEENYDEDEQPRFMTLDDFNNAKNILGDVVTNLDKTIIKDFSDNIYITKAGKLAKNRRNVLYESEVIISNYVNEFGREIYYAMCLVAEDHDTHIKIVLEDICFQ
jgi:hypothetical protein